MIPIMVDMVSAIAGPEIGQRMGMLASAPQPFDESLPVTPKENMKLMLDHKEPRYLPMAGDTVTLAPDVIVERSSDNKTGPDWFGAIWTFEPGIGATMVKPGTEMLDGMSGWQDKVKFPDLEAIDWQESARGMEQYYDPNRMSDWWVSIGLFERMHALMGMENALCALLEEQDDVAEFFEAMTDYKVQIIKKLTKHYKVDMICYHDDWGYNKDGFIPPAVFKKLFVPNVKKIVDAVHEGGAYFNLHSDGRVDHYVPHMVELGMDLWNPAQTVNDLATIKREYGSKLSLNGAMDESWTGAPDASEEKLRAYAREKVDFLGKGGGFYANPATFNMKNKMIMNDELRKYGRTFYG